MIDIIYAILIVLAIIKGYQKGFIIALFSILAFIIGIAAALKLSAVVAVYLGNETTASSKWLPILSFILVFVVVVLLIHLGAKLIQKTVELVMLGWLNRLGGILLYIILYTLIYSVFLFFADRMNLLEKTTISASSTYPFIQPLGPKVIGWLGDVIPLFRDMFTQLESFFESLSDKIRH